MSRTSQSGLAAQKTPAPVATSAKSQFDTFETRFFELGEEGRRTDGERFEDFEEPTRTTRLSSPRSFLLGVAVGSVSVALLGGIGLWLTGVQLGRPAQAQTPSGPEAVVAAAAPIPAPPVPSAVTPTPPATQPSEPAPSPAPAQAAVAAQTEPSPAPALAAAPAAAAVPAPAEKAEPVAAPAEAPAPPAETEPEPAPAPTEAVPAADATVAKCRKAIDRKRSRDVLAACPAAFAAEPGAADIAVALARIEFNRGRGARAIEWGRKAIAIDETMADAYVFVGGGEQMAGHRKAATEAYRRYLDLAPKGRYAGDVRAIVGK
jgi:hypothetical protein